MLPPPDPSSSWVPLYPILDDISTPVVETKPVVKTEAVEIPMGIPVGIQVDRNTVSSERLERQSNRKLIYKPIDELVRDPTTVQTTNVRSRLTSGRFTNPHLLDTYLESQPIIPSIYEIRESASNYNREYNDSNDPNQSYEILINKLDKQLIDSVEVIKQNLDIITNSNTRNNDYYINLKEIIIEHIDAIRASITKLTRASIININIRAMVDIYILLVKLELNINRKIMSLEQQREMILSFIQENNPENFESSITDKKLLLVYLELYITSHEYIWDSDNPEIESLRSIREIIKIKIDEYKTKNTGIVRDNILSNVKVPEPFRATSYQTVKPNPITIMALRSGLIKETQPNSKKYNTFRYY